MAPAPAEQRVQLVACGYCEGPMIKGAGKCPACGTPEGGKEYPYIFRSPAREEVWPLFKWWGIWSVVVWVLAGFQLGKVSSVLLAALTIVYSIRIMRRWVAG